MRYSSAVVLSTLALGQAASLHNRHASFHARREASGLKRDDAKAINWDAVVGDLKDVEWDKINWSSVFASTPVAAPTPTPEQKKPAPATPTPEPKKDTPTPAAQKPAETPKPEPKVETNNKVSDLVTDLFQGVSSIAEKLGAMKGLNKNSADGVGIWVGSGSPWGMEVTNNGNSDAVFYCWRSQGFTGMSINKYAPDVSVGLKPGQKVDLSFSPNVPSACAPATSSSKLAMFGGLFETWAEVTFGEWGAFDVSRNVNMNGRPISMKGSKCTSDMETCVFKCADPNVESCEKGYKLDKCDSGNGGGGGYDPIMDGVGGGCAMGASGEKIKVSFS